AGGRGRRRLPRSNGRAVRGGRRRSRRDQMEGSLRQGRGCARSLRGCGQRAAKHRPQKRVVVYYVSAIVLVAFIFDFINGFHDSANSIATIVGTRVLSPFAAVVWAGFFNFTAAFTAGELVAKAIQKGIIRTDIVTPNVTLAGLLGAIIWNLITWFYGIPSS